MTQDSHHPLDTFLADETGSVTVEFSIILAAIMLVITMFVSLSIHIATASDVQQAAHDLTRQSLRYIDTGHDQQAICDRLHADKLDLVTAQLTFVELARIEALTCALDDSGTVGTVTIAYSTESSFLERAAGLFGLDLDRIERSAQIML